jgi:acyl-CoA-binding protein
MTDLVQQFEAAAARSKTLASRPDNDTLLRLYALYKQATAGDVSGDRPGMFDFVGGAKYDAWAALSGTPEEQAMRDYIALVDRLAG